MGEALPFLALLPTGGAVALLYRAWSARGGAMPVVAALALLVGAIALAAAGWGAGRGIAWIAVALTLPAAVAVWLNRSRKARVAERERAGRGAASEWPQWPWCWLMAGGLSTAASIALAAFIAAVTPLPSGARVMAALLVLTFAWPLLAAWSLGTARRGRTAAVQSGLMLGGGAAAAAGFLL